MSNHGFFTRSNHGMFVQSAHEFRGGGQYYVPVTEYNILDADSPNSADYHDSGFSYREVARSETLNSEDKKVVVFKPSGGPFVAGSTADSFVFYSPQYGFHLQLMKDLGSTEPWTIRSELRIYAITEDFDIETLTWNTKSGLTLSSAIAFEAYTQSGGASSDFLDNQVTGGYDYGIHRIPAASAFYGGLMAVAITEHTPASPGDDLYVNYSMLTSTLSGLFFVGGV